MRALAYLLGARALDVIGDAIRAAVVQTTTGEVEVNDRSAAEIDRQFGSRAIEHDGRPAVHDNLGLCGDQRKRYHG